MIPIRLFLSGFLSYQEPVDLDFNSFDLACISGSNGAGKSSLLDAITWVLFGRARRRDDALINSHAQLAEVIFDFRYESNLYRVQRLKPRDKSSMLEFFICTQEGDWKPLTEKSVRETENRVQSTLRMDYDTFTNASFFLQGRADQFAQQGPADRKKVLSNILGLEVWELYRADASERRKNHEAEGNGLDAQIEDIDAELAQETARKQHLREVEAALEVQSKQRKVIESDLDTKRRLVATLNQQRRTVEVLERNALDARQRFEGTQAEMERLRQEQAGYQQSLAIEAAVTGAYQRWQDLRAELERWDGVAANFREIEARRAEPLTAINTEAARLDQERRTLSVAEMELLKEQERLHGLDAQRAEAAAAMQRLEAQLAGRAQLEADLQTVQASAAEALVENRKLRDDMKELKERIDRLTQVEGAMCPLCGQPLSPDDRARLIANLEIEGKEMGDRYRANQDLQAQADGRVRELQAQIAGLARFDEELRTQARLHDRLEAEHQRIVEDAEKWAAGRAARLAEVTRMLAEQDFALEARAALAEVDAQLRELGYDAAAHDAVRREEIEGRAAEGAMRALEAARSALAPLERQIAGLETRMAEEAASLAGHEAAYQDARSRYEAEAAQAPDLDAAEKELFDVQSEENRLHMEVGMAKQQVAVLGSQRERRARLSAQRENLNVKIARLKTLERAFSKDGVPALLIEQALPEIEAQANELLDRLSNGGMSVRFATQRQYKDKARDDRRETLDIIISDAAGEREYELFSGGEAFRVNFAIRLALSRVLAKRAGARLQTLVIDEGFGSQDADGRQRLIEAINLVRQDFQKILVITHLEELKEAFPARIEVEKTLKGSRVQVVI